MNREKESALDITLLLAGEALVSLLVVGIYLLCDALFEIEFLTFSYRVVTGVILGSAVTVANYALLVISVNRSIKNFLTLRGTRQMDEEEAAKFAQENSMQIQNAIKTSFLIRTVSILVTLVIAFVLDWFDPLATVIPLLAYRPILTVAELLKFKLSRGAAAQAMPSDIVFGEGEGEASFRELPSDTAEEADENNEEKESDE